MHVDVFLILDNELKTESHAGLPHYHYQFNKPKGKPIIVVPHHTENYGAFILHKIQHFCKQNDYYVTAFGSLNQLPLFSGIYDAAYLQESPNYLNSTYSAGSSSYHINLCLPGKFGKGVDIYIDTRILNAFDLYPDFVKAGWEISDHYIINDYIHPKVYIRESSWILFNQLNLPRNIIMCEIKDKNEWREFFYKKNNSFDRPVLGIDSEFQKELIQKVGLHYMSIQVLASLFNNWMFFCAGGSTNLLSILPVKTIGLGDPNYFGPQSNLARDIYKKRYGKIGELIPIIHDGYFRSMLEEQHFTTFRNNVKELGDQFIDVTVRYANQDCIANHNCDLMLPCL